MRLILFIGLIFWSVCATAQTPTDLVLQVDSSQIITLKEVKLHATADARKQLSLYYRSHKNLTLEEIMQRTPDVSFTRRGSYGMEPAIRAFSGNQTNVQIDGMRIHGACTDKMDPVTIYVEPANLQAIQISTGGNGFIGGSTIGGTVNLQLETAQYSDKPIWKGFVQTGYQSAGNSLLEAAQLSYGQKKWALKGSAVYRKQQPYRKGGGGRIDFSQFEKINYNLSGKFLLSPTANLRIDLIGDDGWNIGYPALPMDVGYAGARIGSITLSKQLSHPLMLQYEVKLYANQIRHFMDDTHRPAVAMHMDMPGRSETIGANTSLYFKMPQSQQLKVQADWSNTFLKASMTMYQSGQQPMYMLTWPDNRRMQGGLGADWQIQLDSIMAFKLTGRVDFFQSKIADENAKQQQSIVSPGYVGKSTFLKNLAGRLMRKLGAGSSIGLQLSYAERMPTAGELYGFYLFNANDGYDYIGNVQLKPEKALQVEFITSYRKRKTNIQLTASIASIQHFILGTALPGWSTMTIGAHGVKQYQNLQRGYLAGIYTNAWIPFSNNINWISVLKYSYGWDAQKQPLPAITPLKWVNAFNWKISNWQLQIEHEWSSKQTRIQPSSGENETPGFYLLHVRIMSHWLIAHQSIECQMGIENIFDKQYHEHLDWGDIPRMGRNAFIQLQLNF
ncbi:MAG: hypothetical protein RLY16_1717 [Bacteroidota bacterium]|jgi:iron complex outermembrane receptor protein